MMKQKHFLAQAKNTILRVFDEVLFGRDKKVASYSQ